MNFIQQTLYNMWLFSPYKNRPFRMEGAVVYN